MRSGLFLELYCLDCKFVLRNNLAWMETDLAHGCKESAPCPFCEGNMGERTAREIQEYPALFRLRFISVYQFKTETQRRKYVYKTL